jgi:VWFA-related protein
MRQNVVHYLLMRSFTLLLVIFFVVFGVSAQVTNDDDDVINVDASVVRLNVGVVNGTGRPITHLTEGDFSLFEDGVRQKILSFEPTEAPFSVVMILDMSGSTTGFRETIRLSASRFVDALAPLDRVAVVEFYDKVNVLNDFTSDREKILYSIRVSNGKGQTQLYKALDVAFAKLAGEGKRRKAVIVLTDGVDTKAQSTDREILSALAEKEMPDAIKPDTNTELNAVLESAAKQGVTVYPLALPTGDPANLPDPTPMQIELYTAARKRLDLLATRTGGEVNSIKRLEEMGRLYAQVAANLRTLYTIEYEPTNAKRDGKWRKIDIKVRMPDLISKTRPGYFAK